MYIPGLFKNNDEQAVRSFIAANSFGILVSQVNERLWGTHIPMDLAKGSDGQDILTGHISKANPQWKNFTPDSQVLAIFSGPHTYISSSWYNHENVPTWNYIAVHIYGKVRIIEGERLVQALSNMVDKYEAASTRPVSVQAMSADYLRKQMNGIIGFEIDISEIQPAYKLSQNRDDVNHANIVTALEARGDDHSKAIADAMQQQRRP